MARRGKILEAETRRSLDMLPEPKLIYRLDDILIDDGSDTFTTQKPADFAFFYNYSGVPVAGLVECKQFSGTSLPLANIKEHQIEALTKVADAGHFGVLLISQRKIRPVRAFVVRVEDFNRFKPTKRKSLSVKWLEEHGAELKRVKDHKGRPAWDLTKGGF